MYLAMNRLYAFLCLVRIIQYMILKYKWKIRLIIGKDERILKDSPLDILQTKYIDMWSNSRPENKIADVKEYFKSVSDRMVQSLTYV